MLFRSWSHRAVCVGVCTGRRGDGAGRTRSAAPGSTRRPTEGRDTMTTDRRTTPPHSRKGQFHKPFPSNREKHPRHPRPKWFHPTLARPTPAHRRVDPTVPPTTPRNTRAPAPPADTPYQTGPTVDPAHPHTHPSQPDLPSTHLGYPQIHPHCAPGLQIGRASCRERV